jgi:hemerythrin-like metal-binding protein
MKVIQWSQEFSVGIPAMDAQHQELIAILNDLLRAGHVGAGSETVSEMLSRMREYATRHFHSEEALLDKHGFPDLGHHRQEHQQYRRKIADLCLKAMEKDETVSEELLDYLSWWWQHHILEEDMKYAKFFRERGIVPEGGEET